MANAYHADGGYLGLVPQGSTHDVMMFDGVAHRIIKLVVHSFTVGDVDDPDLYAAQPLWEWENSEAGAWVMENAIETPMWNRVVDHNTYSIRYAITARLKEVDTTYFLMKYK